MHKSRERIKLKVKIIASLFRLSFLTLYLQWEKLKKILKNGHSTEGSIPLCFNAAEAPCPQVISQEVEIRVKFTVSNPDLSEHQ